MKKEGATMRPCPSLVTLSVSLLMLLLLSAGPAAGKTLYVKTSGNDSASCTAAAPCKNIKHAVAVADSGDTIAVGAGTFGEGDGITITKDLTIAGPWFLATRVILGFFDRSQIRPVFRIEPGAKAQLTNLTISGGNGGGIQNQGSLTLTSVWITNNTGGTGVSNAPSATLSMTNVGIAHNSGYRGLDNRGTAFLVDSRVEATSQQGSSQGDGIYNAGTMIVIRGLIAGNDGAGFSQANPECTAVAYLINVTISGNRNRGVVAECGQLILTSRSRRTRLRAARRPACRFTLPYPCSRTRSSLPTAASNAASSAIRASTSRTALSAMTAAPFFSFLARRWAIWLA